MEQQRTHPDIYQLRIVLRGISPLIWRRLLVQDRTRAFIPNYGERYRHGERISTGFVESTVNQVVSRRMVKKQQMRWSQRGAHLLLQIRTRVLNGDSVMLPFDFKR